jgi:8-oxo-dGTP diphosphatase
VSRAAHIRKPGGISSRDAAYVCTGDVGPCGLRGQELAWVRPNRLKDYPMPPADVPLISHLTTLL